MTDLEYLKKFHEIRDISDIVRAIEKLDLLICQNDWSAVDRHLQEVSQKHIREKVIYNSIHPSPSQSIQQNAMNCRQFLIALAKAKVAEEMHKHPGGN